MAVLVSLLLFCGLLAAITYFGYSHYAKPARIYEKLGPSPITIMTGGEPGRPALIVRVLKQLGESAPASPAELRMTHRLLMAAGYRSDTALGIYFGLRVLCCAGFAVIAYVVSQEASTQMVRILCVAGGAVLGYLVPSFVLGYLVERRQEKLRLALPDGLDLMVVCVEAGLGLDQAMVNVARELQDTYPELSEELGLVTLEMRAGKRRAEALRNLADRTGESELRKLVSILIQTDRFGTSMADSLRTHSDFMRVRRKQEAEERANKVSVKLVFPIFFFILPAMFVVAAGPGLLQVFKHLFPLMRNFRV